MNPRIKAHALTALSQALLITGVILAGLAAFYLLADSSQPMAVILAIVTAFGADNILQPVLTAAFAPTIDRLNATAHTTTDEQETENAR